MRAFLILCVSLGAALCAGASYGKSARPTVTVCAASGNGFLKVLSGSGIPFRRRDDPAAAVEAAPLGSAVLILADGYPQVPTRMPSDLRERARAKNLRLYLEYPIGDNGAATSDPKATQWERLVLVRGLGKDLPAGRILSLPDCRYFLLYPPAGSETWLASARVAGFDQAAYGLPAHAQPILFTADEGHSLISATALSRVLVNRAAPQREWQELWAQILAYLQPDAPAPSLSWMPSVRPAYGPDQALPSGAEREALRRGARWVHQSGLLLTESGAPHLHALLKNGAETAARPDIEGDGDGTQGILEGYASGIRLDGSQLVRLPLRADCQAESAMILAAGARGGHDPSSEAVSRHLLEYLYRTSNLQGGIRADPHDPAFGLIAWGTEAPAWEVATYGDDEARVLLASAAACAWLGDRRWDRSLLRALLANLRTTGRRGYRGDRIDFPELQRRGWRSYRDANLVNHSPSFEAYLWACNLWAYATTRDPDFLERTRSAITDTMAVYPQGWRWGDNLDRCRMLLPLAWLVRLEDTPEHRGWLTRVAEDMLKQQQPSGALAEIVNEQGGGGHFHVPASNEAYGTGETPLIQRNGDTVSDQLYAGGFALLGLHEGAAALDSRPLREAENRLAGYFCRIQVHAPGHRYLDGAWFRGFDYARWDYWASSGDIGWGPWCVESGWAPFWGLATLALRQEHRTLWELLGKTPLAAHLDAVRREMAVNSGGPGRG